MTARSESASLIQPRSGTEGAALVWLDALAGGICTPEAFLNAVREQSQGDSDESWEILSLLDQYYRRGRIQAELFHTLKSRLEDSALNSGQDARPRASTAVPPINAAANRGSAQPRFRQSPWRKPRLCQSPQRQPRFGQTRFRQSPWRKPRLPSANHRNANQGSAKHGFRQSAWRKPRLCPSRATPTGVRPAHDSADHAWRQPRLYQSPQRQPRVGQTRFRQPPWRKPRLYHSPQRPPRFCQPPLRQPSLRRHPSTAPPPLGRRPGKRARLALRLLRSRRSPAGSGGRRCAAWPL